MKIITTNSKASDGTSGFAALHLGIFCLPMSGHKKDDRLIRIMSLGVLAQDSLLGKQLGQNINI